jgi:DNA-binding NarL/FixJ family response regulator
MIIVVVDKHPVLRTGLALYLKDQISGLTLIGAETINSFKEVHPALQADLIIMGTNQAVNTGPGTLKSLCQMKDWYRTSRVIVYDERPEPYMVLPYFRAGMNGYISKQTDVQELMDCIHVVLQGKKYVSQEILDIVLAKKMAPEEFKKGVLTSREFEIARHLSQGMRTNWIADALGIKPSTVSTIKGNIFAKLRIDNVIKLKDEMNKRNLLSDWALST